MECSRKEINFLDVTVKLNNNQFVTDLYCKPTDSHQYLHNNSCHPEHMKKFSLHSQGLRIKSFCSNATSLNNHLKDLRSWFCNRGYPESMVKEHLRRVKDSTRDKLLCSNSCVGNEVGVPLIVTYHPHLNGLNKVMGKYLKHLQPDQTVKSAFTSAPFVSFRIVRNLRSH